MRTAERFIAIDIGAGKGEYFLQRSKTKPDKIFIVLEPEKDIPENYPPLDAIGLETERVNLLERRSNLHRILWRTDKDSDLPFGAAAVDEANINFLMGEIRTIKQAPDARTSDTGQAIAYRRLLRNLNRVLKENGRLWIVDTEFNVFNNIVSMLVAEGFTIIIRPRKMLIEGKPAFVAHFFDLFTPRNGGWNEGFIWCDKIEKTLKTRNTDHTPGLGRKEFTCVPGWREI